MKHAKLLLALLLSLLAVFTVNVSAANGIAIDENNFPDANFRTYVSTNIDTDKNGVLSQAECDAVTKIRVGLKRIADLTGIANFRNLKELYCQQNKLTSLDLRANTALESLDISHNAELGTVDVSVNTALSWFACANTGLTSLNVQSNTTLTYLECGNNMLRSLDVSKNVLLEELYIDDNPIESIDLTANPLLDRFYFANTTLTSLDLQKQGNVTMRSGFVHYLYTPNGNSFDLSALPGDFDVSKTSNWVNAERSGSIITITPGATEVTYDYDCGNGQTVTFTLISELPTPDDAPSIDGDDTNTTEPSVDDTLTPPVQDDKEEEWTNPYSDIADDHPNIDAIEHVSKKNVFQGTGKNNPTFSPEMKLTRAQFVTILGRLAGVDVAKYTTSSFTDVDPSRSSHAWFAPYVEWASEQGIVLGYGNGKFGPTDELTIEQALAFLARYARLDGKSTNSDVSLDTYKDAKDISKWALADLQWAVANGIYTGKEGSLDPKEITDRLLTATFIYLYDTAL